MASDRVAAPWYLRLGAWVGIGTGPGALMSGGGAAQVVAEGWLWVALVVGALLLTGLSGAHAWVGQRRGAATVGLARRALGSRAGAHAIGAMIAVGTTLWTGFYVGVAAGATGYLLDLPSWATAVPVATVLWAIHRGGFERWNLVVLLTGLASLTVAVLVFFGVPEVGTGTPPGGGAATVMAGAGAIVAYAAVFCVRVPDFTWDARRSADTVVGGAALLVTLLAFLGLGAGIFLRAGSWELADLVNRTSIPAGGALLLVLSIIAPCVSGIHSAALALDHLVGWSEQRSSLVVAAAAATLGATRFDLQLVGFLSVLGAVVPPVLPVLLLRSRVHRDVDAWVAWGLGAVVSLVLLVARAPGHVIVGIAVPAVWLTILILIRRGLRPQTMEARHEQAAR